MKILTIGDVVSASGCEYLRDVLPRLKKNYKADLTIVNAENSAVGNGVTPKSAKSVFEAGADVTLTNVTMKNCNAGATSAFNGGGAVYVNYHREDSHGGQSGLDQIAGKSSHRQTDDL